MGELGVVKDEYKESDGTRDVLYIRPFLSSHEGSNNGKSKSPEGESGENYGIYFIRGWILSSIC